MPVLPRNNTLYKLHSPTNNQQKSIILPGPKQSRQLLTLPQNSTLRALWNTHTRQAFFQHWELQKWHACTAFECRAQQALQSCTRRKSIKLVLLMRSRQEFVRTFHITRKRKFKLEKRVNLSPSTHWGETRSIH